MAGPPVTPLPRPVLLLTRPQAQSTRFAEEVAQALGPVFDVVISPLIDIEFHDAQLPAGQAGVIFTSENAVAAYARLGTGAGMTAWCVGPRTAQAATAAGFRARSADGDAAALVALLQREKVTGPLLHVRGVHARGQVAEQLNSAGIETYELALYDQVPRPLTAGAQAALAGEAPVFLPVFSPRTAKILAEQAEDVAAPLRLFAFSTAVAEALRPLPRQALHVADRPDAAAMIAALADAIAAGPAA